MTIEKLLNTSIEELEAMTDDQLRDFFGPFLNVTRPDRAIKKEKPSAKVYQLKPTRSVKASVNEADRLIKLTMEKFGIEPQ